MNSTYPLRLGSFWPRLSKEGQDSVWGKVRQIKGKKKVCEPGRNAQRLNTQWSGDELLLWWILQTRPGQGFADRKVITSCTLLGASLKISSSSFKWSPVPSSFILVFTSCDLSIQYPGSYFIQPWCPQFPKGPESQGVLMKSSPSMKWGGSLSTLICFYLQSISGIKCLMGGRYPHQPLLWHWLQFYNLIQFNSASIDLGLVIDHTC